MPVCIEIDNPRARPVPCDFLGRRGTLLRARHDFTAMSERDPQVNDLRTKFREPIPGMRLRVDLKSGKCELIDPLCEPRYAGMVDQLERLTRYRPPAEGCTVFKNAHPSTWLWFMQRNVERGLAKLVEGQFPDKLPEKPRIEARATPKSVVEDMRDQYKLSNDLQLFRMSEQEREAFEEFRKSR